MSDSEEETYSTIFTSLKHPIRRRILRILSAKQESFSDLQKDLRLESPHLTYHLEGLGNLLVKTEDGKYRLSSLGQAAVSTMNQVEEPPRTPLRLPFLPRRWKILAVALFVGVILLLSLFLFQYQTVSQLSIQYSNLKEEHELLQEALREVLDLGNGTLTYEYTMNGTLANALLITENDTAQMSLPWEISIVSQLIYVLIDNCTLEMRVAVPRSEPSWTNLDIEVGREERIPSGWNMTVTDENGTTSYYSGDSVGYDILLGGKVTNSSSCNRGTYSVVLPSHGRYMIFVAGPFVRKAAEDYIVHYTMALQIKGQRDYIPFFIGTHLEGMRVGSPYINATSYGFNLTTSHG
jgi:DNA-binding transcriptional ArsR family regulator